MQHVEAGACPRCPGKEAARRGVYDFIARNQVWWNYLFILRQDKPTQDCIVTFPTTCQDARIQDSSPLLHLGDSVVHESQFFLHAA